MKPYKPGRPLAIPDYVNIARVDASTPGSITVPSGATHVILVSATAFVAKVGTAALATVAVTDGSGSVLVPAGERVALNVEGVSAISVLSTSGTINVHAEFYGEE